MEIKQPRVSVIIPTKEIGYHLIFENLPALNKQSYKNFEVIVLPNQHVQYDLTLLQQYKWLRIIPTGAVTRPAEKRDIGVKESKGDIIAFIDDDAFPTPEWLEQAVRVFQEKKVAAICGPGILPKSAGLQERIFDEMLKTWIGAGGYSYRFIKDTARFVDDYPSMNFLITKKMFQLLGGFNSDYWPGEDSKLCNDLVYKEQGKIYYDPQVVIFHHRRSDLKGYLKQHANYGYHRGAFFAHGDANSRRLGYLVPTFFVIYLGLLILSLPFLYSDSSALLILSVLFLLYIVGLLYVSWSALLNSKNLRIAFGAPLVLFLTHVIYGISFIKGFIAGLTKKNIYG